MDHERGVSRALAENLVRSQFPALVPVEIDYLGEGCDSVAFLVNGRVVFRFPKRADIDEQLVREFDLLPVVARHVGVPIPIYTHRGRPSPAFGFHFGGYALIRGITANLVDPTSLPVPELAVSLGRALGGLHAWDPRDAARNGVPTTSVESLMEEVRGDAVDDFGLLAGVAPGAPLDRWRRYIDSPPRPGPSVPAVVVHADLSAEHVVLDHASNAIAGIIDWSEIAISDPALDFAGLFHWGGRPMVDLTLDAYTAARPDEASLERARYLGACRGVGDVRFGLDRARPEYVRGGVRALYLCVE
jgi:aminoglycoside phosphotransferase (APT) family kinase protein